MLTKRKTKALPQSVLTAQQFVGVQEINDNFLYTGSKYLFAYLSVRAMGDSLLSAHERQAFQEKLAKALEKEKKIWQLISVPYAIDTQALMEHLLQIKKKATGDARLALVDGEIDAVQEMARSGAKEPRIFIKLWAKEGGTGERDLEKRIRDLANELKNLRGIDVKRLEDQDIGLLCKVFADLDTPQNSSLEETRELPVLQGKEAYSDAIDIANEVTPAGGITFMTNGLKCGSTSCRIYSVSGYPSELASGWLTDVMNNTEAVTCITFDPANHSELANKLSKSIRRTAGEAISTKDVREQKSLARKARDADAVLTEMEENYETMGMMSILTMPFTSKEEELEEVCNRTVSLFSHHRIKLKVMGQLQREGFMTISPYHPAQPIVEKAFCRLVPLFTMTGGSPMCINSYQDAKGFYFAKTITGNLVSLDNWLRGGDRTNSNFVVLGKAGMGKSTLIKHIMQTEFMTGTKILIIDPEGEYREITEYLGGVVFYAGGGNAKINPLQVRTSPVDDDEEQGERLYTGRYRGNDLAMHIKNTDAIFRTYFVDAPETIYALLEEMLIELYKKFSITWDSNFRGMPNDKFPIMEDFYSFVETKLAENPGHMDMGNLKTRLYTLARGSSQFIFNGHTNIDLNAPIQCFDIKELQNTAENVRRAQYQNILSLNWDTMSRNPEERVLEVADELYLMIDKELPQSLLSLRNMEKRCRKFNGALGCATHSAIDLLDPSVRQYGQAILDIPTYKYFLGADGQALKELTDLYDLTEAQQNILRNGGRKEALAMLGNTTLHLRLEIPQYKLDNMGTAGGA